LKEGGKKEEEEEKKRRKRKKYSLIKALIFIYKPCVAKK
jgi:hypothetical protein